MFDVIGFDADDTLWHSEDGFRANEERFVELVTPYAPEGVEVQAALTATERKNLGAFGYGVKSFGLSMVEAAVTISGGRIPSTVVAEMVEMVRAQLEDPVRLLDQVPEVLAAVGATHRMILITKGDLIHQSHKVTTSGL
ncbi:MAG: HAD family hydrolase, partial [Ilumatobacteraceae bacterium]